MLTLLFCSAATNSDDIFLSFIYVFYFIIFSHQHKAAHMKIKLSKNNDHDGVSHGVECSQEGDSIRPLNSNRQALEQEHRLSCVFRDCSDASTNFLDRLYGGLIPGTGSFNCHWQKDVRGRQRIIPVGFLPAETCFCQTCGLNRFKPD